MTPIDHWTWSGLERPIDILYLDNHLIAAIKPPGVLSQADHTDAPDMLTILKAYIKERFNKPGAVFLGLVHRLDRPVGGVMVFARTSKGASRLSASIREHRVQKSYLCVTRGIPDRVEAVLEARLVKDRSRNVSRVVQHGAGAKEAKLRYQVLATDPTHDLALLQIELLTGRAHQIRVQLADNGTPLWGDAKYGNGPAGDIALWSCQYSFPHPTTGETVVVEAPPPQVAPWASFPSDVYPLTES